MGFVRFPKADPFLEQMQVVVGNNQFVLGFASVWCRLASTVRQQAISSRTAILIQNCNDAQPRQHALNRFEGTQMALREPHANPFLLITLHAAIRIKEPAQEASMKLEAGGFERLCHLLLSGPHAELGRQFCQPPGADNPQPKLRIVICLWLAGLVTHCRLQKLNRILAHFGLGILPIA